MERKYEGTLTTGEAMTICGLPHPIIIKWFDNGFIQGFRVGGQKSRRIYIKSFLEFLKKNNIPYRSLY